ncbi:MAG TPA: CocE/NonD family hydrolase, partial [Candidatus Dormibacteraeota bacterium]
MTTTSRVVARLSGLRPAESRDIAIDEDLRAAMRDGTVLLADRLHPRDRPTPHIVLIRTPYGRRRYMRPVARAIAERGYQVVVQSTRGTFGSEGVFDPFRHEAADGEDTLAWLADQPWFGGSVAMTGASYLGYVQWSVAASAPPYLKALAPQVTASEFGSLIHPDGSFALDSVLSWVHTVHHQEGRPLRVLASMLGQRRALAAVFSGLPLTGLDVSTVGRSVSFYQDWLEHRVANGGPFWSAIDHSGRLAEVVPPVTLLGGWYDLFLPRQLDDYTALREAGLRPQLTIGPWTHAHPAVLGVGLRESLAWFDVHLRGRTDRLRAAPVRIFVMGAKAWRDLEDWPPPSTPTRWHLHGDGGLAPHAPATSPPDRYDYDPANPTPSVGGIVLGPHAGPRDNRRLEARPDVLVYTSAPLESDLEVIGRVSADLHVRSSCETTDFFVRLCDVEPSGRSVNICDGLAQLRPGRFGGENGTPNRVRVDLWPTAHRFRRGHRVRVQVSSGAHPRFVRNLGGGEPLGTGRTVTIAHQEVHHDPDHPSAVVLP